MSALGTLAPLGLAFVLCSLVGLERELRQKSAGALAVAMGELDGVLQVATEGLDDSA